MNLQVNPQTVLEQVLIAPTEVCICAFTHVLMYLIAPLLKCFWHYILRQYMDGIMQCPLVMSV